MLTLVHETGLKVSERELGRTHIVSVCGRLNRRNSAQLRRLLTRLRRGRAPAVLLDLRRLRAIDSSGVATFLECLGGIWHYGGDFGLFGARPEVAAVFEMFRLEELLPLFPDEVSALRARRSPPCSGPRSRQG